jgi:hypothetical protein
LEPILLDKGLLDRVEATPASHTFDGGYFLPLNLDPQNKASIDQPAIE